MNKINRKQSLGNFKDRQPGIEKLFTKHRLRVKYQKVKSWLPLRLENFHQEHKYTSIMGSESNFMNKLSRN